MSKTILILTAALSLMAVATMFAPPVNAQCVGGRCYGVPQTIYRPRIIYQPMQYQGSQVMTWQRRTPIRTLFFGPPQRQYHFYAPQPQPQQQYAPQPQAGQ